MTPSATADYETALTWLYDRIDYEKIAQPGVRYRFTLDRMRQLVRLAGHGDRLTQANTATNGQAKVIHIAGTKGKGSVANMIATLLQAAGFRVGLYTSPHLSKLEERFLVNGQPATQLEMTRLIDHLRTVAIEMETQLGDRPSFFEMTTTMAADHFHNRECDMWVIETGLGGRLDSTNVFQSDLTVLTTIGLDHQHVLGNTLEEIAAEKAGILKPNVPVVNGVMASPAREVIAKIARQVGAPPSNRGIEFDVLAESSSPSEHWGSRFTFCDHHGNQLPITLGMEGAHQIDNAAIALQSVRQLGVELTEEVIGSLAKLQIPARLERFELRSGTVVILDAAHNPDSIGAMLRSLRTRFGVRQCYGVFASSMDKDAATMLRQLLPELKHLTVTQYTGNPRFIQVAQLQQHVADVSCDTPVSVQTDPVSACEQACQRAGRDGVVIACGSFFLAGELRPWLLANAIPSST